MGILGSPERGFSKGGIRHLVWDGHQGVKTLVILPGLDGGATFFGTKGGRALLYFVLKGPEQFGIGGLLAKQLGIFRQVLCFGGNRGPRHFGTDRQIAGGLFNLFWRGGESILL